MENQFAGIILTSLDAKPLSSSDKLLLVATARSANTDMKWNDKRTSLLSWGSAPVLIEPVKGRITLRNLKPYKKAEVIPLNGEGKPLTQPIALKKSPDGPVITIGQPATTWYLINIKR